jgi:hypothetical protein
MWRSGQTRRRQQTAVSQLIETAQRTGSYTAPWRSVPGVWEFFSDEADLLRHLQQTWRNALAGAVYVAIEAGDGDLQADVTRAFATVTKRHGGLRKILEAHAVHPAIAAAMRKEQALLTSVALGVSADPGQESLAA